MKLSQLQVEGNEWLEDEVITLQVEGNEWLDDEVRRLSFRLL